MTRTHHFDHTVVGSKFFVAYKNVGDTFKMNTITKKELVEQVAQQTGADRGDTRKIVQAFLDAVVQELNRGNRLEFRDFGVFEVRQRAPRMAQNPKTLEPVKVPAKRSVRFKPGRLMREQSVAPQELVNAR